MGESQAPQAGASTRRWLVLVGALMVQLILGTVYGFSVYVKPLQAAFDWSNKEIQGAFNLALLTFAVVMVPAGRLQDRKGPQIPALFGAVFLFLGAFLASFIHDASQKWLWWLSYGVLFGAGIGLAYVCPIAALTKWFPDIKGLITGIAVAGFGGGAAYFAPSVTSYLAPDGGGHSLSQFFITHGIVCGAIVALGALLLCNPPADWTPPAKPAAVAAPKEATADVEWNQMVRSPLFALLWLMFMGSAMAGLMTIGVVKAAVNDAPAIDESSAALAVSVLSMLNAIGRVFWGGVSDRIGRRMAMTIMFGLQTVAMFLVSTALGMGAAAAFVIMGLIGLNFGGNFALFPSATADAFGTKNLGVNYGFVFTAYGIGGVIGPQCAAWFKDSLGAYGPAFAVAGVLVGTSCALSLLYGKISAKPAPAAA